MIYVDEKYADPLSYQFPDRFIDPKEKEKEYHLQNCKAIYSTHIRNKSGIPIDILPEWEVLRAYGRGMQDQDQYIRTLTGGQTTDTTSLQDIVSSNTDIYNTKLERRKAWSNVNKQIISPAPKIKDHFYGMFKNQEYEIVANTIDEDSGALVEDMKFKLLANTIFQKELAMTRRNAGLQDPTFDFMPKDITELELFEASGGFKLNYAMETEKLIKHTFDISDWDNTIKRKVIDDAVDIGYIAVGEDVDGDTGKSKISYHDISNIAIQYSTQYDYNDSEWVGHMDYVPVSKLRQKGFSKEFLLEQTKAFSGQFGNPQFNNEIDNSVGFNRHGYDAFKVPVFTCYWIDMDAEYEEAITDARGRKRIKPVRFGMNVDTERKEIRVHKERKVYSAKWVIGTDEVYDYGITPNQTFKNEVPVLPIRVVKVTDNSIIKRLRPVFDDMQIAWLKYQNAQIMAMNAGYAINVRLLNNISLGGKKLGLKEVFDIMKETGNVFYSDTPIFGKYEGGAVSPVTPLPGGMGMQLQEAIQKFQWAVQMIEHETGITSISMGATPRADQGKATTEMSLAATQNVLRPIIDSIMVLKGRIAEDAMLRIQLLVRTNEQARESYTSVVGRKGVESLLVAEKRGVSYGIMLEPRPTQAQKERIYGLVNEAMTLGRDGVTTIGIDDAILVNRQLDNGGNLKEIELKLSYKIRKYKEAQIQKEMNTIKVQSEELQKQNAQKAQMTDKIQKDVQAMDFQKTDKLHGQDLAIKNFEANKDYKLKLMDLANSEKEIESREKIAMMSNNNANTKK